MGGADESREQSTSRGAPMSRESTSAGCRRATRALARALASAALAAAASADPLSADRPGQSSPPNVVAPGAIQLEGGFAFERETAAGSSNANTIRVPQGLLRVGVLPFLELRASADGFVFEDRAGASSRASASDFTLGSRARVLDQSGAIPATALEFGLSLPTGSNSVTSDGVDPSGALLFEWALGARFALDLTVVLASTSLGVSDSRRAFSAEPALSLGAALTERASVFVEYYAVFVNRGLGDQHSIDGGFAWLLGDDLQLDVSAGAGLNDSAPDFFVSAGVAWRFRLP